MVKRLSGKIRGDRSDANFSHVVQEFHEYPQAGPLEVTDVTSQVLVAEKFSKESSILAV